MEDSTGPEASQEFSRTKDFVNQGLDDIRNGDFQSAINHFEDSQSAGELGLTVMATQRTTFELTQQIKDEDTQTVGKVSDILARQSSFNRQNMAITLGRVAVQEGSNLSIPTTLEHEVALLHAEEWVHALQYLNGNKPLTSEIDIVPHNPLDRNEVDVALYLSKNGVPLTDHFLKRSGRRQAVDKAFK